MKKRILSLGLLVIFLLGAIAFPACGEKKPPEPKPETVTVYGEFYTIKEAYEQGYVTRDDLDYIVKYEREKDKFDLLAESQKEKILHDYKATHLPVSDQLEINSYGSYHGCAAVLIRDRYYENWLQKTILPYKVGDKGYTSETLRRLRIWKESETPIEVEKPKKPYGAFYSLQKAYEHGFLTQKDLLQISEQTYFDDPSIEQIIKENRLLSLGLFVVFLLGVTAFPACGKKKPSEPKPETVTVYGEFYTVNEAYEKKYLMLDELNHISKNENTEGIFERLEEAQKEKILHDYKATHPIASEQLEIKKEYGIYRNCVVIWIHDPYYDNKLWETVIRYLVGDRKNPVTGFSSNFWQVRVWKECETPIEVEKPLKANGEFYSLEKAYEYGLLTEEDIEEIVKVPGTIIPPGGQEVSNKIIQDYRSFGMEGTDGFEIEYYGAFNDCIALSIGDLYYCDDGLQEGYAKFTIGAIEFWDRLPFFNVWKPIK